MNENEPEREGMGCLKFIFLCWVSYLAFLLLILILGSLFPVKVGAELPPQLPHSVSGVVDLADGSLIEAWGEDRGYRYAATYAFWYEGAGGVVFSMNVPGDDPTTVEVEGALYGELVTFFAKRGFYPYENIGWAAEKISWLSGANELLDLHFEGGTAPTPTDTPLPTPQLRLLIEAPSSGGGGQDRSQAKLTISIGESSVTLYVSAEDIVPMIRLLLRAFLEGVL